MLAILGVIFVFLLLIGIHDFLQTKHAILRNFPIIGHFRYLLEEIGPEIRQYWIEQDTDGKPYDRRIRSYIYQSAKGQNNKIGFGTQKDYNKPGQIHLKSTMFPVPEAEMPKTLPVVIGKDCAKPFVIDWPIGISDMSFGALSEEAVSALSSGAKEAGIHMGTGEGGLTPYHVDGVVYRDVTLVKYAKQCFGWLVATFMSLFSKKWLRTPPPVRKIGGTRLILELGPAKFGFQTATGELDLAKLIETAKSDQICAIQIKLGQGAKLGLGGVLPSAKITPEIAAIRNVPMGQDCVSPNCWSEFRTVEELAAFIEPIQQATGKPVGIKFGLGGPNDDYPHQLARLKAETGKGPDFWVVDGGEGGTGAAPLTHADHVGMPIMHAIPIVDNALRAAGVRDRITLITSGKVAEAADIFLHLSLGADLVNIGRGFLLSLGCIQALRCHTNMCPTGVTTQNKWLRRGLDPREKRHRVANYAKELQHELRMLLMTAGVKSTKELNRSYASMVVSEGIEKTLEELYPYPSPSRNFCDTFPPEIFPPEKKS